MKLFLALMLVIVFSSCNSEGSREVKFRAKGVWRSTTDYKWRENTGIYIIDADSSFIVGDTIGVGSDVYVLQQRLK